MTIAFVNSAQASDDAGLGSITLPATSLTAGNLLVVGVRGDVGSISDTAGNTFVRAAERTDAGIDNELWYAKNALGNASNVVTVTYTGTPSYRRAIIAQYSGCDTAAPLDATATGRNISGGTSVTSDAFSTAWADEVIVAHASVENLQTGWTPDTGYTEREETGNAITVLEDKIVSSTQSGVTASYTAGDTAFKSIVVATFRAPTAPAEYPLWAVMAGKAKKRRARRVSST